MQTRAARTTGTASALVVAVSVALTAAGCTPSADNGPSASAAPSDAPALSAMLYQSRMDVDDRQVQVKLQNEGESDVVVDRMTFTSSGFDAPMVYRKRGSVVRAGGAVDMPVVLSRPVCDGAAAEHTVVVDQLLDDGTTRTVRFPAVDEHGAVADLHEAECFALEVGRVATLSVHDVPRLVPREGRLTAELVVDVTATGGREAADLQVQHVAGTTLLQHVDPETLAPLTDGLELDTRAPDAGTESFTLTLVPSRCDAHAVAEDKQGTRFRVLVDLDGRQGVVPVVSPDPVKVALYEFVRQACAGSDGEMAGPDG